jgi:hypothetical protein
MSPEDPGDVTENRRALRHIALVPIRGFLSSWEVSIHDLAEGGFQIEHADPLKLAASSTITFDNPETYETMAFVVRVVWSRLSSNPNARGRLLYRSGLRIEQADEASRAALKRLIALAARPDTESLERKRRKKEELRRERSVKPAMKIIHQSSLPAEHGALIHQARKHLRANPVEAMRWYNRAKFSLTEEQVRAIQEMKIPHRDDVLAVWEYLQRRFPLAVIAKTFDEER